MLCNLCECLSVSSQGVCFATSDPIDHEEAPNAFTENVLNIKQVREVPEALEMAALRLQCLNGRSRRS